MPRSTSLFVLAMLAVAAPAAADASDDAATTAPIRLPVLGVGTRVYSTFDAAHVGDHDGGLATNTYVSAGATVAVDDHVELWGVVPISGLPLTSRDYLYGPDLCNITVGGRWIQRHPRGDATVIVAAGAAVALPTGPEYSDQLPQQAVLEPGTFASDSTTLRADGQLAYVGRDAMIEGHALGYYRRAGDGHDDEFLRFGFELGVAAGLRVGGRMWATVEGVGLVAERYDAYPGYANSRLYGDGVVGAGLGYRGRAVQAGVSAYLWRAYAIPMFSATVSVPL